MQGQQLFIQNNSWSITEHIYYNNPASLLNSLISSSICGVKFLILFPVSRDSHTTVHSTHLNLFAAALST